MTVEQGGTFSTNPDREMINSLVSRSIGQDPESFAELYTLFYPNIVRYCLSRLGTVEDAEDVTQAVFTNAWRGIGNYRQTEVPFESWLYRIARNEMVNLKRRSHSEELLDEDWNRIDNQGPSPEELVIKREQVQELDVAIHTLDQSDQTSIAWYYLDNLPHREIAERLGISEANSRMHLHHSLDRLKGAIIQPDPSSDSPQLSPTIRQPLSNFSPLQEDSLVKRVFNSLKRFLKF